MQEIRRGPRPAWTLDKCLEAIQSFTEHCAATGLVPSRPNYEQWQRGRNAPSGFTIEAVCGSWNQARLRAGEEGMASLSLLMPGGPVRWPLQQCLTAVKAFSAACEREGIRPTGAAYTVWAKSFPGDAVPSLRTIVRTLSSFSEALRLAALSGEERRPSSEPPLP